MTMSLRPALVLSTALLVFACSEKASQTTTPDGSVADGAAGDLGAADAAVAGEGGTASAPVCTPGADQTCNDNLAVSALHGRCLADRTCSCTAPFTKNPATGKCTAGFMLNNDGGADAGPSGHPNCQAFCQARQINKQQCAIRNGDRNLRESYQECIANSHEGRCPTGPSCGGWLQGCLDDPQDAGVAGFDPGSTCAQSVAAGLFRP